MSEDSSFDSFVSELSEALASEANVSSPEVVVRRPRMPYKFLNEFTTASLFDEWWESAKKGWKRNRIATNSVGQEIHYYICSKNQNACKHKVQVIFSAIDESVRIETTLSESHDDVHKTATTLTEQAKAKITELHDLGLKPAVIRTRLLEILPAASTPTLKQIQNFVGRLKPKSKPLTDYDLMQYAESNLDIPEDQNKPYVVCYMPYEEEHFVIVWTTQKLLQIQNSSTILATDATYKLNWHGFPVFVAGTFDINNSFHPTYLAVASHEDFACFSFFFDAISDNGSFSPEFILADAAQAITNAAKHVFPNATRLMCWAHCVKNVDKKLKGLVVSERTQIRQEIEALQFAISEEQFCNVSTLLVNKWKEEFGRNFEFANYFKSEWLDSDHFRWFEGASAFPSTNNALENLNKQIKSAHTFRERLPFIQLTAVIERMLEFDWSIGRTIPGEVEISIAPHIFADAYKMKENGRKILTGSNNQRFIVLPGSVASMDKQEMKQSALLVSSSEFDSFDEYKEARFKVYNVEKFGEQFICSCPIGSKKKPCKHAIMIECRLGKRQYPPDATAQVIGQKRKRGRLGKSQTQRSTQTQSQRSTQTRR